MAPGTIQISQSEKEKLANSHLLKEISIHINRIGEGVIERGVEGASVDVDDGVIRCALYKIAQAITLESNSALTHITSFMEQKREQPEEALHSDEWLASVATVEGMQKLREQHGRSKRSLRKARAELQEAELLMLMGLNQIQRAKTMLPDALEMLRKLYAEQRYSYVLAKNRVNVLEIEVEADTRALRRAEQVMTETDGQHQHIEVGKRALEGGRSGRSGP